MLSFLLGVFFIGFMLMAHQNYNWRVCYEDFSYASDEDYLRWHFDQVRPGLTEPFQITLIPPAEGTKTLHYWELRRGDEIVKVVRLSLGPPKHEPNLSDLPVQSIIQKHRNAWFLRGPIFASQKNFIRQLELSWFYWERGASIPAPSKYAYGGTGKRAIWFWYSPCGKLIRILG